MEYKNHKTELQDQEDFIAPLVKLEEVIRNNTPDPSIRAPKTHKPHKILSVLLGIVIGTLIPIAVTVALAQMGSINTATRSFIYIFDTPLEYRINAEWEEKFFVTSDWFVSTYLTDNGSIAFTATNPNKSNESSTSAWISNKVDFFKQLGIFVSDEFEKIDTKVINGHEFSIYRLIIPEASTDEALTDYYAVLKTNSIDIEITSSNLALINEFLDGLTIGLE